MLKQNNKHWGRHLQRIILHFKITNWFHIHPPIFEQLKLQNKLIANVLLVKNDWEKGRCNKKTIQLGSETALFSAFSSKTFEQQSCFCRKVLRVLRNTVRTTILCYSDSHLNQWTLNWQKHQPLTCKRVNSLIDNIYCRGPH